MTLQQPAMQHHRLPWGLELVGAALLGAALLFGMLLVAGHSDLIPSTSTVSTPAASVDNNAVLMNLSRSLPGYYGSEKTYVVAAVPIDNNAVLMNLSRSLPGYYGSEKAHN